MRVYDKSLTMAHERSSGDLHEHYDSKAIVDGKPVFALPSHILQVRFMHCMRKRTEHSVLHCCC